MWMTFGPVLAGSIVMLSSMLPSGANVLKNFGGLIEAFAGGSVTSTAVTPTIVAMISSSAPAARRKRRCSTTDAICFRSLGTAKRLL